MKQLLIVILMMPLYGQAQKFNKLYHARNDGRANAVIATNNGCISVGLDPNGYDAFGAEVNYSGDTVWGFNYRACSLTNIANTISRLKKNRYIIGGGGADITSPSSAASLIWLRENGDTIRTKKYGLDSTSERCYGIRELANGNIVFAGWRFKKPKQGQTVGDCDVYIVGTDSLGNQQWENVFGGPQDDQVVSMDRAKDGGFILGGYTYSYGTAPYNMYLVKIDSAGNLKWQKTYGSGLPSYGASVITTQDGGFVLAGGHHTGTTPTDSTLAYIIKTDDKGTLQWQKHYRAAPNGFSEFTGVKQLPTGELVACGHFASRPDFFNVHGWLMKLNQNNGNVIWQRDYRYFSQDSTQHYLYGMDLTPDGGFVMCGMERELRNHYTYGNQVWLVKTDAAGCDSVNCLVTVPLSVSISVTASSGNNGSATATAIGGNSPYNYLWNNGQTTATITGLSAGTYYVTVQDSKAAFVIDTAVVKSTIGIAELSNGNVQQLLSPNPFSENTTLTYSLPKSSKTAFLSIYDIKGTLVHRYALNPQENSISISANDFENGVYLYGIEGEGIYTTKKKMVVVK